jgi:fatty-acyl-CoA synthase
MRGMMMDFQLTVPAIVRRAETLFGARPIVTRRPDRSLHRQTLGEALARARWLAAVLASLGVRPGHRVATLAWTTGQHFEAYFAIPSMGAVLHTLNLRLHPDELSYIINDAEDRVLIVDESLLPLWERVRPHVQVEHVLVTSASGVSTGYLDYEAQLAAVDVSRFVDRPVEEQDAAAMCYTSGTTGKPKGVLYSHRSVVLHAFLLGLRDTMGLGEDDVVLPVVPMFHVNAWGLPFACPMFGCGQIFPGPHLDAKSVADLLSNERVTLTAGVPTVWLSLLQELDEHPSAYDLSRIRAIIVGGSAAPLAMIRGFEERHHLNVIHAWGMTEMSPLGTLCNLPAPMRDLPLDEQFRHRAKQGTPVPLVEIRARGDRGLVAWDDRTLGELEVRGACVAGRYYSSHSRRGASDDRADPAASSPDDRFTDDGWFKTGDIVKIAPSGCIELADRSKDLVKSGGEWISSVALENALMGHPAVAEAAVIAVPHPKWDERPLAVVVLKAGHQATAAELTTFLEPNFAKWWLPDAVEFISEIPRTSAGKFLKATLRERYRTAYGSS